MNLRVTDKSKVEKTSKTQITEISCHRQTESGNNSQNKSGKDSKILVTEKIILMSQTNRKWQQLSKQKWKR